jgi:hypothetical protein
MKTVAKMPVAAVLATAAVLLCPAAAHAGLGLDGVNSPTINQQQNIETSDGSWGLGGENTITFSNFNNVGGVRP